MTLPCLQTMQDLGINIQLIGKPWIKSLLAGSNCSILTLDKSFWRNRSALAAISDPRRMLLLTNSLSSALLSRLGGKSCIGYNTDRRAWLLSKAIDKPYPLHEVELFWNLCRIACEHWFADLQWPDQIPQSLHLPLHNADTTAMQMILNQTGIKNPYWVLCPFAHGKGHHGESKIWPHWLELSNQLAAHHQLVVCPGPNERKLCDILVPKAQVLDNLSLGQYAAVLAGAERVIANDSGPMHISTAVGAPTLGIFGVSEPQRVRPWGGNYIGHYGQWPGIDAVFNHCQ